MSKYSQYSKSGELLQVSDQRGTFSEYVYLGGSLVAIRERTGPSGAYVYNTKYQHTDALGSPIAVTDASKALVERNEYEPFGYVLDAGPAKDGPGYTGHVLDAATGLNYMQQRYYDPIIGRFLSVDPVAPASSTGDNFNRFWYANNNPYRYIDPDGRVSDEPARQARGVRTIADRSPSLAGRVATTAADPGSNAQRFTETIEVVFWDPVGEGRSSLGHVTARDGDDSYSFAPGGMDKQKFEAYLAKQSDFRNGHGYKISLTPEQKAVVTSVLRNYDRQYNYLPNNCTAGYRFRCDSVRFTRSGIYAQGSRGGNLAILPDYADLLPERLVLL